MNPPQNILVPIDFSQTSTHALTYAQTVARACRASVHVLHVIPDPRAEAWSVEAAGMDLDGLLATWRTDTQRRLDELTVDMPGERVITVGHPFTEITRYAESHGTDLIVMGTHGRGAIEHMLLGSVTEKVIRRAPCPVLTVRDKATEG